MDNKFTKVMEDTERRMQLLEQAVYSADGPERRFERIESVNTKIQVKQKTDYEFHQN